MAYAGQILENPVTGEHITFYFQNRRFVAEGGTKTRFLLPAASSSPAR